MPVPVPLSLGSPAPPAVGVGQPPAVLGMATLSYLLVRRTGRGLPVPLVAGVDSSTQACKVSIRDAENGRVVRSGRASHPAGTEVHPDAWEVALERAIAAAGGIDDVQAIAVAAQQHGMVALD